MSLIILNTSILAPIETVFDLSRSIDLHIVSTRHTNEKAVAGVTSGLIGYGESVTWNAYHLFKKRNFTSKITGYERPFYFRDEMIQGDFKSFSHEHFFEAENDTTTKMTDRIIMISPFALLGKFVNKIWLRKYISELLSNRNNIIKDYAESGKSQEILMDQYGKC